MARRPKRRRNKRKLKEKRKKGKRRKKRGRSQISEMAVKQTNTSGSRIWPKSPAMFSFLPISKERTLVSLWASKPA